VKEKRWETLRFEACKTKKKTDVGRFRLSFGDRSAEDHYSPNPGRVQEKRVGKKKVVEVFSRKIKGVLSASIVSGRWKNPR